MGSSADSQTRAASGGSIGTGVSMFDTVGSTLAVLRQERGLSQAELAAQCRIGRPQISKYEAGRELMKLDTLAKILSVLRVDPDQFFCLMAAMEASLRSPLAGPGEAELCRIEEAFETLRAAIDQLQRAIIENVVPTRNIAALTRQRGSPPGGPTVP